MSAKSLRPRRFVHRGVVTASAIVVERARLGEAAARRRVLAAWEPGATLQLLDDDYLVTWPRPRLVDCARAPGLPLVHLQQLATTAPLDDDERERLAAPAGAIVRVRAAAFTVTTPARAPDPADWLALAPFTLRPTQPLVPLVPPSLVIEPPVVVDRATFGAALADAPPGAARVAKALQQARAGAAATPAARGNPLTGLFGWLARLFAQPVPSAGSAGGSGTLAGGGGALVPARPRAPSLVDRLFGRVRGWVTRAIVKSQLGRLIGRRQAEYLRDLIELLQRGDVTEGLRRALPLGDGEATADNLLLGLPDRRQSLRWSLAGDVAGSSMALAAQTMARLRALYRQTFERLQARGDVDQAAFVLVELLRAYEEAVQYLERNGRLRLAAELAESRELPPGLVVRQWLLAKDVARALRIAEEKEAFADAVARLQATHLGAAGNLRMLWADRLATRGDFLGAVEVAWSIAESRPLRRAWIERGLTVGGVVAARLLVRQLELGDDLDAARARVIALLDDPALETLDARVTFRAALAGAAPQQRLAPFARAALRSQLRDDGRFGAHHGSDAMALRKRLLARAGDAALRTDLPPLPGVSPRPTPAPIARRIAAEDRGTLPIYDVARLPSGDLVLALGELGARLVRRDGRPVVHFDLPTHELVLSDHGDRALALAPRGDATRVALLDLRGRRSQVWADLAIASHAHTFDGASWFIGEPDAVVSLDVEAETPRARWRVDRLEDQPYQLMRHSKQLSFLLVSDGKLTRWTYDTPQMALRARAVVARPPHAHIVALHAERSLVVVPPGDERPAQLVLVDGERFTPLPESTLALSGRFAQALVDARWLVLAVKVDGCVYVQTWSVAAAPLLRGTIELGGATRARVHLDGNILTAADDCGRVVVLDLASGTPFADLRLHVG